MALSNAVLARGELARLLITASVAAARQRASARVDQIAADRAVPIADVDAPTAGADADEGVGARAPDPAQ